MQSITGIPKHMARTIRTKVYKFNELSEPAKQKAIEWFLKDYPDYNWWEDTYNDAKENSGLIITESDDYNAKGKFEMDAFYSANLIVKNHGEDCETFKTAMTFLEKYADFYNKATDKFDAMENEEDKEELADVDDWIYCHSDDDGTDLQNDYLKSLLEDYRIMLRNELEYLTSEEQAIELIKANEYEFTKDGTRFS